MLLFCLLSFQRRVTSLLKHTDMSYTPTLYFLTGKSHGFFLARESVSRTFLRFSHVAFTTFRWLSRVDTQHIDGTRHHVFPTIPYFQSSFFLTFLPFNKYGVRSYYSHDHSLFTCWLELSVQFQILKWTFAGVFFFHDNHVYKTYDHIKWSINGLISMAPFVMVLWKAQKKV